MVTLMFYFHIFLCTVNTGTRDVVGEFGGICMPNSPMPLAKTMLETLAACKKWCKIGGAPDLQWRDIDLSPNPTEVSASRLYVFACGSMFFSS